MTTEPIVPAPLPEQIFAEFFRRLESATAHDPALVDSLRRCLANGSIGDRRKIQAELAVSLAVTEK